MTSEKKIYPKRSLEIDFNSLGLGNLTFVIGMGSWCGNDDFVSTRARVLIRCFRRPDGRTQMQSVCLSHRIVALDTQVQVDEVVLYGVVAEQYEFQWSLTLLEFQHLPQLRLKGYNETIVVATVINFLPDHGCNWAYNSMRAFSLSKHTIRLIYFLVAIDIISHDNKYVPAANSNIQQQQQSE